MTSGFSGMQGSVITTAGCLLRRKQREDQRISQSRAALETERDAAENVPAETVPAENAPPETVPPEAVPSENVPPETVPPAGAAR